MKRFKKFISLFLTMVMLLSVCSIGITVSATDTGTNTTEETPLKIEIETDTKNPSVYSVVGFTVKITNTGDEDLTNVTAQTIFDDLSPVNNRKSETTKEVETLKAGESFSYSYRATLNMNNPDLHFFNRFILWFVRLFNGGYTVENTNIDDGRTVVENITEFSFDGVTAENVVNVGYTSTTFYRKWFADVEDEHVVYTDGSNGYIDNRIIIFFNADITESKKIEIVKSVNGTIIGESENKYQIQIPKTETEEELNNICSFLMKQDGVFFAMQELISRYDSELDSLKAVPNDKWKDSLQGTSGTDWDESNPNGLNWWLETIQASSAWDYNHKFNNIKIGIVDGGFETNHEDLNLNILNPDENATDDTLIYDVIEGAQNHGTHVAGIIGATANNNKGITGIVWNKKLYCVDVFATREQKNENVSILNIYEGIEATLKNGCKVINMSIGKKEPLENDADILKEATYVVAYIINWQENLNVEDFVIVQGAGNDKCDTKKNGFFSSITDEAIENYFQLNEKAGIDIHKKYNKSDVYSHFINVGAIELDGSSYKLCSKSWSDIVISDIHDFYSCYGENIDIVAPGYKIFSTILMDGADGSYGYSSGTSMASPMVTGVASLVWSVNPNFTAGEVKEIVCNYYNKTASGYGDDTRTYPIVNAKLAVEEAIRRTDLEETTIKGTVTDSITGEPISDVWVEATDNNDPLITIRDFTDEHGQYSIPLENGSYVLSFSHNDYKVDVRDVIVGIDNLNINVKLVPINGGVAPEPDKCNISFTVVDEVSDKPIENVVVEVTEQGESLTNVIASATTDKNGRFTVELPEGEYSFLFTHDNYYQSFVPITVNSETADATLYLTPIENSGGEDIDFSGYVHSGGYTTSFIDAKGNLFICGSNSSGQLGNSDEDYKTSYVLMMSDVKMVHGSSSFASITKNNQLYTWGYNGYNQLGYECNNSTMPTKIEKDIRDVCITSSTCAYVTQSGDMYIMGYPRVSFGDLNNTSYSSTPIKVLENVIDVELSTNNDYGETFAAITKNNELYMWGVNQFGIIVPNTTQNVNQPTKVMDNIKSVSIGNYYVLAITTNNELYAWGKNTFGQLGNGNTKTTSEKTKIMDNVIIADAGSNTSLAININGELFTWGSNVYGCLGQGIDPNKDDRNILQPTKIMDNVKSASIDRASMIILEENGNIYTCGWNQSGQLGTGDIKNRHSPYLVYNIYN